MLLLYGLAHGLATDELANLTWYLAHAVMALVIGMALFAGGVIGRGDGKFYAGIASYSILWDGLVLLLAVSVSGIVLVLLWFAAALRAEKAKLISARIRSGAGAPTRIGRAAGRKRYDYIDFVAIFPMHPAAEIIAAIAADGKGYLGHCRKRSRAGSVNGYALQYGTIRFPERLKAVFR